MKREMVEGELSISFCKLCLTFLNTTIALFNVYPKFYFASFINVIKYEYLNMNAFLFKLGK